jgi:hypothetical protein
MNKNIWHPYLTALNKCCDAAAEAARHTQEAAIQADIAGNYASLTSDYVTKHLNTEKVLK